MKGKPIEKLKDAEYLHQLWRRASAGWGRLSRVARDEGIEPATLNSAFMRAGFMKNDLEATPAQTDVAEGREARRQRILATEGEEGLRRMVR